MTNNEILILDAARKWFELDKKAIYNLDLSEKLRLLDKQAEALDNLRNALRREFYE